MTEGAKEYSRQRKQHMNVLGDTKEQAHLKKLAKFCVARKKSDRRQTHEGGRPALSVVSTAGGAGPQSRQPGAPELECRA